MYWSTQNDAFRLWMTMFDTLLTCEWVEELQYLPSSWLKICTSTRIWKHTLDIQEQIHLIICNKDHKSCNVLYGYSTVNIIQYSFCLLLFTRIIYSQLPAKRTCTSHDYNNAYGWNVWFATALFTSHWKLGEYKRYLGMPRNPGKVLIIIQIHWLSCNKTNCI